MKKLGKITLLATAAEAARQWAKNNPDKANDYIDKASAAVDKRTKGKYSKQLTGATQKAKEAVTKGAGPGQGQTVPGSTVPAGDTPTDQAPGSTPPPPPPGA